MAFSRKSFFSGSKDSFENDIFPKVIFFRLQAQFRERDFPESHFFQAPTTVSRIALLDAFRIRSVWERHFFESHFPGFKGSFQEGTFPKAAAATAAAPTAAASTAAAPTAAAPAATVAAAAAATAVAATAAAATAAATPENAIPKTFCSAWEMTFRKSALPEASLVPFSKLSSAPGK